MEDFQENLDEQFTSNAPLFLKPDSYKNCKSIANWTLFFSILGFIFIGLMLIGGLFLVLTAGALGGGDMGGLVSLVYFIFSLIYLLPVVFMFKFSRDMSKAISLKNNENFNAALANLKTHFLIVGVFTILVIIFYFGALIYIASMGIGSLLNSEF